MMQGRDDRADWQVRHHDRENFHIFVSNWEPAPRRLDSNVVICAIGDVHGHLKHLAHLMKWIRVNVLNDPSLLRHLNALDTLTARRKLATEQWVQVE
jgi:hypothetical protein